MFLTLALGTVLASADFTVTDEWEMVCERPVGATESSDCRYVRFVYDSFLSLTDWFIRGELPKDADDLRYVYIINGHVKFGDHWHFFTSGPHDWDRSVAFIGGFHELLSAVPHRLKLVNLGRFRAALNELDAMRDESGGIESGSPEAQQAG